MSNELPSDIKKRIDLVSYTQSNDQILLPANDISDEIMPALLLHFSRSLNDVLKIQDEGMDKIAIYEKLEKILGDLMEAGDMFKRLKRIEQLFNEQLKALLLPYVDKIDKLKDEISKEGERTPRTENTPLEHEEEEEAAEIQHQMELQTYQEEILAAETMAKQLPDISKKVSKLKKTLDFIPKDPLTAHGAAQSTESSNTADNDRGVETGDTSLQSVESASEHIFQTIQVSSHFNFVHKLYENLGNIKLKRSLLCLLVFPDNSVVKRRAIINWWIGENLVHMSNGRCMIGEWEADKFLSNLVSMGFIEPVLTKQKPLVKRYRMHPFTRLMLIPLAARDGFLEFDSSGKIQEESFSKSRKAFLTKSERGSSQYSIRNNNNLKHIETLFNINESFIDIQNRWFSKIKDLKVIQLGRWQTSKELHIEVASTDFLRHVSNMKNLRHLSLQGISRISELPVSFSNLGDLRILDLKACHDLRKLPSGIGQLKNLTFLDMSECYFIAHMPKELALLSELQALKGFLISDPAERNTCRLADLANLQKLEKLSIYADGGADATTELQYLKKFKALRSLSIAWVGVPQSVPKKVDRLKRLITKKFDRQNNLAPRYAVDSVSSSLRIEMQPSDLKLEKLDLLCTPWERLPDWLNLQEARSLKKLYIRGGKLRDLHSEKSWTVEILRLKYLSELEMNWKEVQAAFPSLYYLEKLNCPKLNLFPCDHNGVWTHSLKSVLLYN